jgi:signal transduction histidine kinase
MVPFLSSIQHFWAKSMTRRLAILMMALHTLLFGALAAYLVIDETEFFQETFVQRARIIAQAFAANSKIWLLSRDTVGMDELVHSLDEFPGIQEAMLLDTQGRILAHSQIEQVGTYIPNAIANQLASTPVHGNIAVFLQHNNDSHTLDIATPVTDEEILLGWARLRIIPFGKSVVIEKLVRDTAWLLFIVLMLSGIISWWIGRLLTNDLSVIVNLSNIVRTGNYGARANLSREDEIGQLAANFNLMLAAIQAQEEQLKVRADKLARSNTELEHFAYVASHDLQEPLRMVSSYVQLLARRYRGKLDQDADEFIGYAVDGASRMQQLINDLLAYSRVDRKGGEIRHADMNEALEVTLKTLQVAIKESQAVIDCAPLPSLPIDTGQIIQLQQTLISNALKFHGDQPPVITIRAQEEETAWRFSIRDNGIGIEAGQEERIFQMFQRLHSREAYPGTGIGLAICKRIVERHGGRINVISQLGQGSEFWFTLSKTKPLQEKTHA